jgi:uncharacterized protein
MTTPYDMALPDDFSGTVRLFPLPNLVMFPHVLQPLHIFEPRYRTMLADALEDDRLICLALLAPGWEKDYDGRPPLHPIGCLGRIVSDQRLSDGKSNILLLGLRRVGITHEEASHRPYRQAEVIVHLDRYPVATAGDRPALRKQLVTVLERILKRAPAAREHLERLLDSQVPLGVLCDILASTIQLPCEFKQRMLAELDVDCRARLLLERLGATGREKAAIGRTRKFPPDVSLN